MTKVPVSVVVAARNEEANIRKCLEALAPADQVIVADSNSSDDTIKIAMEYGCDITQFSYQGGYPKKRQWVLDTFDFQHPWVLMVDADEVITPQLWEAIEEAISSGSYDAYLIRKQFHFLGRAFSFGGFSHEAVLLFRRDSGRFEETLAEAASGLDMEIHERIIVDGRLGTLSPPLVHEDFKGLQAYINRHNAYSTWEAQLRYDYLYGGGYRGDAIEPSLFGDDQARRRFLKHLIIRLPFEPLMWFFYHYLFRLGFLEGRAGLIAAQMRSTYIRDVRSKVYELRRGREAVQTTR